MTSDPVQTPARTLNNGHKIPLLGLGTYPMSGNEAVRAVSSGLSMGYRLIDTAAQYGNEEAVGQGIRDSGVPREDLVVTTKLRGSQHGYTEARSGLEQSLERLGLDYVDLYLIHWPLPRVGKYADAYRAMLEMASEGLIRSVGVSNFLPDHIERLLDETGVAPAVNQLEISPALPRVGLRTYLDEHDIAAESWSPLGIDHGVLDEPVVAEMAERHGREPGQIVLRWHVQQNLTAIPKSGNPDRQRTNARVFDFELSEQEMARLSALDRGESAADDPVTHEEF